MEKTVTKKVFKGKGWVMALWIIFFWPGAIVYYFARCESETIKERGNRK